MLLQVWLQLLDGHPINSRRAFVTHHLRVSFDMFSRATTASINCSVSGLTALSLP